MNLRGSREGPVSFGVSGKESLDFGGSLGGSVSSRVSWGAHSI